MLRLLVPRERVQHRALQVCGQQGGIEPSVVAQLLGQQPFIVLDYRVPDCTLNLGN
ncbi:hypothetical protein D3C80_1827370 [compost metagenome]